MNEITVAPTVLFPDLFDRPLVATFDTEDPTHGAQQLTLFNGSYGGWCYLLLVAFLTVDDEPPVFGGRRLPASRRSSPRTTPMSSLSASGSPASIDQQRRDVTHISRKIAPDSGSPRPKKVQ